MSSPNDLLAKSLRFFLSHFFSFLPFWLVQSVFLFSVVWSANLFFLHSLILSPGLVAFSLIWFILHIWVFVIYMSWLYHSISGRTVSINSLFAGSWSMTIRFIFVGLILTLILAVGSVFLIIPGLIFYVWFAFILFIFISQNTSIVPAFVYSYRLSQKHFWLLTKYLLFPIFFSLLSLFAVSVLAEPISFFKPLVALSLIPVGTVFLIYIYLLYFAFKHHFSSK